MIKIWAITMDGDARTKRPVYGLARPIQTLLGGSQECQIDYIILEKGSWDHTLTKDELLKLPTLDGKISEDWPDIVLTAHQGMGGPIALAIKQASGGKSKLAQIQGPNAPGLPHYDLEKFDVIVRQPHEPIEQFAGADNVIGTKLAVHDLTPEALAVRKIVAKEMYPDAMHPMLVVNLGGSDEYLTLSEEDFADFGRAIEEESYFFDEINVIPMARTTPEQLAAFKEQVRDVPNVFIRDKGAYDAFITLGDYFVTSCEGSLLGSEAIATGKPAAVYPYGDKIKSLPLWTQGTWPNAIAEGKLGLFPDYSEPHAGTQEDTYELARQIIGKLGYTAKTDQPAP